MDVWMQTSGVAPLAVERRSSMRMRRHAQDGRSARGLLYPTAVRDDFCQQEPCQGRLDIGLSAVLRVAAGRGDICGHTDEDHQYGRYKNSQSLNHATIPLPGWLNDSCSYL